MIAIDTNVLVRYAVKDDPRQTLRATQFIKENECLVSCTVILELAWVLAGAYKLHRADVLERIMHILQLPTISVESMEAVLLALEWYKQGMDFADALHLALTMQTQGFATFDKRFINKAKQIGTRQLLLHLQN